MHSAMRFTIIQTSESNNNYDVNTTTVCTTITPLSIYTVYIPSILDIFIAYK